MTDYGYLHLYIVSVNLLFIQGCVSEVEQSIGICLHWEMMGSEEKENISKTRPQKQKEQLDNKMIH